MARTTVILPDAFNKKLNELGRQSERIIEKGLEKGGDLMRNDVRANLKAVIGHAPIKYLPSRTTGELLENLGRTTVKIDSRGIHNVKVGFGGTTRTYGKNAKVANVLEYGTHDATAEKGQEAKPFLNPTIKKSRRKCVAAIKDTLSEEINRIL